MVDQLANKRLIFVTGKGGVGKSTAVAALGRALARRGERTLIVETDEFSAMQELLDVELPRNHPIDVSDPQTTAGALQAVNLDAEESVVSAIGRFVPSRRVVRALVGNRVARVFLDAAPGVNEFAFLDQIRTYLGEEDDDGTHRYDHILVDLPASGHAITYLSVAQTYRDMIKVGPIADRAGELADLIGDANRTAIVAVSLPEELPVNETLELESNLRNTLGRGLTLAMLNMVHAPPVEAEHRDAFSEIVDELQRRRLLADALAGAGDDPEEAAVTRILAGSALALDWYERDRRYVARLHDRLQAPIVDIPVVYEADGGSIVDGIARLLNDDTASGGESDQPVQPFA